MQAGVDDGGDDPYLWLEEIDGPAALQWVATRNLHSQQRLTGQPEFTALNERLLKIYNDRDRIPMVTARGPYYYNFWQDENHPRGIWRRTTPHDYAASVTQWEVLLDLDALCAAEGEDWVFGRVQCLYPGYQRALVSLSRGGSDAHVVREFDVHSRSFVPGGFELPEAKSSVAWIDHDTIYVGTNFGVGSLTDSGYPRQVKLWRRGTALSCAELVFEGSASDISVGASRTHDWVEGRLVWRDLIYRGITFYSGELYLRERDLVLVQVPKDAAAELFQDQLLISLRSDWTVVQQGDTADTPGREQDAITWPQGATLAINLEAFLAGDRRMTMIYTPGPRKSLAGIAHLRHGLVVNELVDLQPRAALWRLVAGRWFSSELSLPAGSSVTLAAVDADTGDACFMVQTSPVRPTTLSLVEEEPRAAQILKRAPEFFDATGMRVEQFNATSADGTRIPYCAVLPRDFVADGTAPTLLYAYGGFEVALLPVGYNGGVGAAWLERGGVYVVAGIRGGAEFGPAWHQAALKENKQRSYDDLIAVAEDLVARDITAPAHLGIQGGSNGGLLVGAVMLQRPQLFGAVVCQVPLLDMRRYHRLLAGVSWVGEYGDPDKPDDWATIARYSPYQNVRAGVRYPPLLLMTSTRDDRVHPGHARKMAARMDALGHEVLYYENVEGGHAGSADNRQAAFMSALAFTFLLAKLR